MNWLPKLLPLRSAFSDEEAMRNVQARCDHAAFTELVRRWEAPIRRLCIRMTGNEHRGEELTQETFARVFAGRGQFQPNRKFSTWLWRIALNTCFEEARRAGAKRPVMCELKAKDDCAAVAAEPRPDEQLIGQERIEHVRRALSDLPEELRVVAIMRHYEGLKFREIAEVLEIPEGTVKWRMAGALARLGLSLKPFFPDESGCAKRPLERKSS